jgi:hypothetical protein
MMGSLVSHTEADSQGRSPLWLTVCVRPIADVCVYNQNGCYAD